MTTVKYCAWKAMVWIISTAGVLSICGPSASAELMHGATCPPDFTCFAPDPTDGTCKHPALVLDDKMKVTRYEGDRFSRANESACLAMANSSAARKGHELRLTFDNGKSKSFKDERQCEKSPDDHCKSYLLYDYFSKGRLLLIHAQYYESDEWFLVSQATGKQVNMVSPPGYSPDKHWLASVYATEGTDDANNGIDIVPADLSTREPAFHYRPKEYELWEFVGWDGNDRFMLKVTWRVSGNPELVKWAAEVVLANGVWKLNKLAPASTLQ